MTAQLSEQTSRQVDELLRTTQLETPVDVHKLLADDDFSEPDSAVLSPLTDTESESDGTPRRRGRPPGARGSAWAATNCAPSASGRRTSSALRAYKERVEAAQAATRDEVKGLRAAQAALEQEVPALRERLRAEKARFAELRMTRERYEAVRRAPDDKVSVVDWVRARASSSSARRRRRTSRCASSSRGRRRRARWPRPRREAKTALARARGESGAVAAATAAAQRATAEATGAESAAELRQTARLAKAEAAAAERERAEAVSRAEMLLLDKAHLVTAAESAAERAASAEAKLSRKEAKVASLKAEKAELQEKLLKATSGAPDEYSRKLEGEMEKWSEQSRLAQNAAREAHDRQLAQAREAREMATADADQQAARHAELRRQYDELVVRSAEGASRAEVELAHCRAELKLKTHEAERLALQCETALADARRDEVSADAWREKLEVLRSEYYTLQAHAHAALSPTRPTPHPAHPDHSTPLQADTAQRGATLEAQNAALSEKLRQYERLEEELDAAVIAAGEAAAAGGGTPGSDAIAPLAMIRVPSAAERRVQQCLALARQAVAAQGHADEMLARQRKDGAEIARLEAALDEARGRLRMGNSPQSVILNQLAAVEAREADVRTRLAEAQLQLAAKDDALGASQAQKALLEADLKKLLEQRGSLDLLRGTLSKLLGEGVAGMPPVSSRALPAPGGSRKQLAERLGAREPAPVTRLRSRRVSVSVRPTHFRDL